MPPHPASFLYQPTEEEEAYAIYIYEKLFGNFPADGSIHLEARPTLAILAKSGVESIIVRTIWSVADSENTKCLTDMAQLHVVLRLIALAQDGLLEAELNRAFNMERNKTTPVAVFQKTLWMSSDYRDCPFPSFEGVPVPPNAFLKTLSNRIKGTPQSNSVAPTPTPAPAPLPLTPVPAPTPQISQGRSQVSPRNPTAKFKPPPTSPKETPSKIKTTPSNSPPPSVINVKKPSIIEKSLQSAIQQIETLGVGANTPNLKNLKELDPDNFELLQEQAALQQAITEANHSPVVATFTSSAKPKYKNQSISEEEVLCEDEALQKAIYESTHAASPKRQTPKVAAAPPKKEHQNWLRMTSFDDSTSDNSDDEYKKKKAKKGAAAYAEYLASLDPSNNDTVCAVAGKKEIPDSHSQNSQESDKKPSAKPAPLKEAPGAKLERSSPPNRQTRQPEIDGKDPPKTIRHKSDDIVDEYPQAVQELVMNGFALEKAIQGYKMLGDNFDDIVLFLTSNMTVKELVINGFNIHKVVQAYDLIGDNMDDLLAYLMSTTAT